MIRATRGARYRLRLVRGTRASPKETVKILPLGRRAHDDGIFFKYLIFVSSRRPRRGYRGMRARATRVIGHRYRRRGRGYRGLSGGAGSPHRLRLVCFWTITMFYNLRPRLGFEPRVAPSRRRGSPRASANGRIFRFGYLSPTIGREKKRIGKRRRRRRRRRDVMRRVIGDETFSALTPTTVYLVRKTRTYNTTMYEVRIFFIVALYTMTAVFVRVVHKFPWSFHEHDNKLIIIASPTQRLGAAAAAGVVA